VRERIRSDSNSAIRASIPKNILPIGSPGS